MTIDITALQILPEVTAAPTGLMRDVCYPGSKTKIVCEQPSCRVTKIVVSGI